jgi:propanol-preferring alcohol dehydrogenase
VVEWVDVPDPDPGPGEVVIATRVTAVCGSELKAYGGEGLRQGNFGHEAAGVVDRLGEGVQGLQAGQRVGASCISGCGHCDYCEKGQYTWCRDRAFYGQMHAERFVASARACRVLPDDVSWDVGVLITGDGLGVPYHTSKALQGKEIESVAILGLGPIGLGSVLLQGYLGRRVIGVDVAPERLKIAMALGAAQVIDASETEDVVGAIRAMTGGQGPDVCIEAAGRPDTAKQCFAAVRTAGTVVFNGEQPAVELSPSEDFIRRDITAVGVWYTHFSDFPAMLDLYRSGLQVDRLVTHRFPMLQAGQAYQAMAARETGKVVLTYET